MKERIYELVVDVWRLAAAYGFRKMGDSEWEEFICRGNRLVLKYCAKGDLLERLCRDLLAAFQDFYQRKGKE